MKNEINFHVNQFSETDNKKWLPSTYRGIFLKKAEEDYVACRVFFMLNLLDIAYYHLQQCIEKYLKTYILDRKVNYHTPKCKTKQLNDNISQNEILCRCLDSDGHKLEKWAGLCGEVDVFFLDIH